MPHSISAAKSHRRSEKRRLKNKGFRSEIRTWTKKFEEAVANKDTALARQYFLTATKKLDKAAKVGVYHRNTAGRKKSAIARMLDKLGAPPAAAAAAPT